MAIVRYVNEYMAAGINNESLCAFNLVTNE